MNTLSLTPLFRQSVGFDRFNDLFEAALRGEDTATAYPPYNIEKHGEDHYAIVMAVAGFREEEINLVVQQNRLTVSGRMLDKENDSQVTYLHRGIATRAFERTFSLADHVKVSEAELKDGLLRVHLQRIVPEDDKPRMVPINGKAALEAKKKATPSA